MCMYASCPLPSSVCAHVSHHAGAQNRDCSWAGYIRTGIGRAMGQWQVGASSPGTCAEVLLALATVRARGVVFTLTLQAALSYRAQVGMQVALTPEETRRWEGSARPRVGLWSSGEVDNSGAGVARCVLGCPRRDSGGQWSIAHSDSPSAQRVQTPSPMVWRPFLAGQLWTLRLTLVLVWLGF